MKDALLPVWLIRARFIYEFLLHETPPTILEPISPPEWGSLRFQDFFCIVGLRSENVRLPFFYTGTRLLI